MYPDDVAQVFCGFGWNKELSDHHQLEATHSAAKWPSTPLHLTALSETSTCRSDSQCLACMSYPMLWTYNYYTCKLYRISCTIGKVIP